MRVSPLVRSLTFCLLLGTLVFGFSAKTLAAAPQLDAGKQTDLSDLYTNAPAITGNIFENRAVYGKLEGETPIDVYSFVPEQDGKQTIRLLARPDEVKSTSNPYLVLLDSTANTTAQDLGVPTPDSSYHSTVITQIPGTPAQTYLEPVLLERFTIVASQEITLSKGKTYYFIVLDSDKTGTHIVHYAIQFGTGKSWTAKDFFTHFGSWWRLKVESYGSITPFSFGATVLGYLILLLGLVSLVGSWIMRQSFNLLANRSKTAAYLLVRQQMYLNVLTWIGLWFTALGAYMYFTRQSWSGLPFLIALVYIVVLIIMLIDSIMLSKQVRAVEIKNHEATLPLALRKKLFVTFVLGTISLVGLLLLVSMLVAL